MSTFNNNFQRSGMYPSYQNTQNYGFGNNYGYQPPISTNVIYVTSLDEALIKTTACNSDIIYFHQDQDEFYRVKVDANGRKSYMIFNYMSPNQNDGAPVTRAEYLSLVERINALEGAGRDVKTDG